MLLDVVVIGGGPAGLSAALMLGRCRRRVLLVDEGHGRNRHSRSLHGYLTRDGLPPERLRRLGRAELRRYGVEFVEGFVIGVRRGGDGRFKVRLRGGRSETSRAVLLATGVRDLLPDVPGFADCYGVSVHHCPYCDAWEHRDKVLAAYGSGKAAVGLALSLRTWSERVLACTGGARVPRDLADQARANGIEIIAEPVGSLEHARGRARALLLTSGRRVSCDAVFFNTGQVQRSDLPRGLGCEFKKDGGVKTDRRQRVNIPGVYLAGDACREVQFAIVAAAEGATAAVAINRALQDEDRGSQ